MKSMKPDSAEHKLQLHAENENEIPGDDQQQSARPLLVQMLVHLDPFQTHRVRTNVFPQETGSYQNKPQRFHRSYIGLFSNY